MSYTMSQYRYTGQDINNLYTAYTLDDNDFKVQYLDWAEDNSYDGEGQNGSNSFQDVSKAICYRDIVVSLTKTNDNIFKKDQSYYISFSLPRDANFNFNFGLYLFDFNGIMTGTTETGTTSFDYFYREHSDNFQFIKYFTVSKGSKTEGNNVHRVVGFKTSEKGNFCIAQKSSATTGQAAWSISNQVYYEQPNNEKKYVENALYYNPSTQQWWMPKATSTTFNPSSNNLYSVGDALIALYSPSDPVLPSVNFEFIFTPRQDMSHLVLRLLRVNEDSDIITKKIAGDDGALCSPKLKDKATVYGRYVNLSAKIGEENNETVTNSFKLYKLEDLLQEDKPLRVNAMYRFGIWGEPWTMMAINGEEIRIGPSGYYELNDFKVTEFSVVPRPKTVFIIDYQHSPTEDFNPNSSQSDSSQSESSQSDSSQDESSQSESGQGN